MTFPAAAGGWKREGLQRLSVVADSGTERSCLRAGHLLGMKVQVAGNMCRSFAAAGQGAVNPEVAHCYWSGTLREDHLQIPPRVQEKVPTPTP